jgi:hypothetical protein
MIPHTAVPRCGRPRAMQEENAVKKTVKYTLVASFMSGSLVAFGMGPMTANAGVAGAPYSPYALHAAIQLVADSDVGTKKDDYLQRARNEMQEWRQKWDRMGEKAEAKGHEAKAETKEQLNAAWAETKEKWNKLQGASGDAWDDAKRSYEKASAEFKEKWHKVHPEDE